MREHPSETRHFASQADAALLDVLRLQLFIYRNRLPGESVEGFRGRHPEALERRNDARHALVQLSGKSPTAVFSAVANLLLAVRSLSEQGILTTLKLVTLDLEINAEEDYIAAVAMELERADPDLLRELGIAIT